jgi:hypothetical protein
MRSGLGLEGPAWPYLRFRESKAEALAKYAGDRRWAWVDDEADPLSSRTGEHGFIVVPNPKVGLTDKHVKELLAFANSSN